MDIFKFTLTYLDNDNAAADTNHNDNYIIII